MKSRIILAVTAIICSALGREVVLADDTIPEKEGYVLDFHDEFNGDSLDTSKWTDYYLPHWTANPENAKANYRFEDGKLVQFIAKDQKPWSPELDGTVKSSAIMSFNKNWIHNFSNSQQILSNQKEWVGYATTYGYFELRAKFSNVGGGGHQAWWMVGLQDDTNDWFNSKRTGEIDVIETFFRRSDTWRIASFGWNDPFFSPQWYLAEDPIPHGDQTAEYHTYGLDWSPGSLKFYYDGTLYKEIKQAPDYPMGTILNIYTDAGSGKGNDVYPKEWAIDYFRVYKKKEGYELPKKAIINRDSQAYFAIDSKDDKVYVTTDNSQQTAWKLIPKGPYYLIQNTKTGEYLNIESEKPYVEHSILPETAYSAQWSLEEIDGHIRFVNRWKPTVVIHTENQLGYLEASEMQPNAWRSQWKMEDEVADAPLPTPVITTNEEVTTSPIPFKVVRTANPHLPEGEEKVLRPGKEGLRTLVELVTLTDGVETKREIMSDTVTAEPIDQLVEYGPKAATISTNKDKQETPSNTLTSSEDPAPPAQPSTQSQKRILPRTGDTHHWFFPVSSAILLLGLILVNYKQQK